MKNKKKSVLLFSGGLDSFILNKLYKPDILLYIDMGLPYQISELGVIRSWICFSNESTHFIVHKLNIPKKISDNGHVPLRNTLFIQIAAMYGDIIYLGALKGETSRDKTNKFRRRIEKSLNYQLMDPLSGSLRKKVKVLFPFRKYTKSQIIKKYIENKHNVKDLENFTRSCYNNGFIACGECMSCFRRYVAEMNNNIKITRYNKHPISFMHNELDKMSKFDKFKQIFRKEFWMNLPSNIEVLKVIKKGKGKLL